MTWVAFLESAHTEASRHQFEVLHSHRPISGVKAWAARTAGRGTAGVPQTLACRSQGLRLHEEVRGLFPFVRPPGQFSGPGWLPAAPSHLPLTVTGQDRESPGVPLSTEKYFEF